MDTQFGVISLLKAFYPNSIRRFAFGIGLLTTALAVGLWILKDPVAMLSGKLIPCPLKALIHVPCPFCGLTRGVLWASQGQWEIASRYHGLSVMVYWMALLVPWVVVLCPEAFMEDIQGHKGLRRLGGFIFWGVLGLIMVLWVLKLGGPRAYW